MEDDPIEDPINGAETAIKHFLQACPYIKTRKRAVEELAIAGGSAALAVGFARFREKWLDKQYGRNRKPYDADEAARFAAAVRYKIDLSTLWKGPCLAAEGKKSSTILLGAALVGAKEQA